MWTSMKTSISERHDKSSLEWDNPYYRFFIGKYIHSSHSTLKILNVCNLQIFKYNIQLLTQQIINDFRDARGLGYMIIGRLIRDFNIISLVKLHMRIQIFLGMTRIELTRCSVEDYYICVLYKHIPIFINSSNK